MAKVNNHSKDDFSIRKEIEIELTDNLKGLDIDADSIYNEVEDNKLMLDTITLSIYTAVQNQLKEKGIQNEDVNYKINQLKEIINI